MDEKRWSPRGPGRRNEAANDRRRSMFVSVSRGLSQLDLALSRGSLDLCRWSEVLGMPVAAARDRIVMRRTCGTLLIALSKSPGVRVALRPQLPEMITS